MMSIFLGFFTLVPYIRFCHTFQLNAAPMMSREYALYRPSLGMFESFMSPVKYTYLVVEPVKVVREAVTSILVDDLFSIGTDETKQCLTIAQILMQRFSKPTETEIELASWLIDNVSRSFKCQKIKQVAFFFYSGYHIQQYRKSQMSLYNKIMMSCK